MDNKVSWTTNYCCKSGNNKIQTEFCTIKFNWNKIQGKHCENSRYKITLGNFHWIHKTKLTHERWEMVRMKDPSIYSGKHHWIEQYSKRTQINTHIHDTSHGYMHSFTHLPLPLHCGDTHTINTTAIYKPTHISTDVPIYTNIEVYLWNCIPNFHSLPHIHNIPPLLRPLLGCVFCLFTCSQFTSPFSGMIKKGRNEQSSGVSQSLKSIIS